MQANLTIQFTLTEDDKLLLKGAIDILEKVKDEFSKCGTCTVETEVSVLACAAHILDEVRRGEAF